ncbi:MAG: glycoside hydrolase family 18 protein [Bacillota bacterium]|nr:glycoside hydrolase family 18 protein [Bacillota bacterium]
MSQPKLERQEAVCPFVAAYVFDRNGVRVSDRDLAMLDRVNYAFGLVVDGRISGDHWTSADQLAELKRKKPELLTILSLGGWGAGGFSDACATAAGRERFAQSAVELMLKYDFDGIDLDWEYPTIDSADIDALPEDKFNFTKMMRLLRSKFAALSLVTGRYYRLSMAIGCGHPRYAKIMEMEELGTFLDEINLMSYDMRHGTRYLTGHHANLYPNPADESDASGHTAVELIHGCGVPLEKIVLGAAFYGRCWTGVQATADGDGVNGLHAPSSKFEVRGGDYEVLVREKIGLNGFSRYWDDIAKAPWLFDGSTFISYEDPESLRAKGAYVRERGLGGLMYWEYAGDTTGELLTALREGIDGEA